MDDQGSKMKKTTVTINGKKYPFIHDKDEDYIKVIERYVNGKVMQLVKEGMQLNEAAAMLVVAITITDELFQTQKNFNTLKTDVTRMLNEYDELKQENDELRKALENR